MSNKKDKAQAPETGTAKKPATAPEAQVDPVAGFEKDGENSREELPGLEQLQKELEESRAQAAEYKDGWQRAVADFQNYKRRVDADSRETYQNALGSIIKRYLPIVDDLERALAHRPADLPWADGVELIYRKLATVLENEGVQRIEAQGKMFDPNFHEAIGQEPVEGVACGQVIDVVQQGYMIGERVIRPALVRVAQ